MALRFIPRRFPCRWPGNVGFRTSLIELGILDFGFTFLHSWYLHYISLVSIQYATKAGEEPGNEAIVY